MPSCRWFATGCDHDRVLQALFTLDGFEVRELHARPGTTLRRFADPGAVLAEMDRSAGRSGATLVLHLPAACPEPKVRQIVRQSGTGSDAGMSQSLQGPGLIQFYLNDVRPDGRLDASTSNHNTRAGFRARSVSGEQEEAVDFRAVASFSSKLNRRIRALGVAKLGGASVLPGALAHWDAGGHLGPWSLAKDRSLMHRM